MADIEGVRNWFSIWGQCVANVDFARARPLFDEAVIGMGTYKDRVHGIDALENGQWRSIWPTIRDFEFDVEGMDVLFSPDGCQAVAIVAWNSTGIDETGTTFSRPGRATVALRNKNGTWLGEHTHFSVCPAEKKTSFGDASA